MLRQQDSPDSTGVVPDHFHQSFVEVSRYIWEDELAQRVVNLRLDRKLAIRGDIIEFVEAIAVRIHESDGCAIAFFANRYRAPFHDDVACASFPDEPERNLSGFCCSPKAEGWCQGEREKKKTVDPSRISQSWGDR